MLTARTPTTAAHKDSPSCLLLQCRAVIAVGRPSIGTVRYQRASLGPLDHLGPRLSLVRAVLARMVVREVLARVANLQVWARTLEKTTVMRALVRSQEAEEGSGAAAT